MGGSHKTDDAISHLFITDTHADVLFFTSLGRVFQLKAHELPEFSRSARGQALVNFLNLGSEEKISAIISLSSGEMPEYFFFVTKKGIVKKTERKAFDTVRKSGLIAIRLKKDDELCWVKGTFGKDQVILVSAAGQAIRFKENEIRPMGRPAAGIRGMRLKGEDRIVGINIIEENESSDILLAVSENGIGKFSKLTDYREQKRGGSGIRTMRVTGKTGPLAMAELVSPEIRKNNDLIVTSLEGQVIRTPMKSVPVLGRNTQGVKIIRLNTGDKVASGDVIEEQQKENDNGEKNKVNNGANISSDKIKN